MEKSLKAIEDSLKSEGQGGKGGGKTKGAANVLGGMGADLDALIAAVSINMFDEKKADAVITFSEKLVEVANKVSSTAAKDFGEFATGLGKAFEVLIDVMSPMKLMKLYLASKLLFGGKKPLLTTIVSGMQSAFSDVDGKNLVKGTKGLEQLGEGLLSLTKAMKGLILMGIAAPLVKIGALVARGIAGLFVGIGKKSKSLEQGAKSFETMGKGILWLTAGLSTLTLAVMVIGPAKILESIVVISAFALVFTTIGLAAGPISRGAKAISLTGLALFGFAAGLASLMLAVIISTPAMIIAGIAAIAGFGIVFALLGKASKSIAEGALLLIGMSFALFLFSGGLMVFGLALKLFDLETAALGAIMITEIGLAMAVLGKYSKQITNGAIVMAEMGVALGLFGIGAMIFGVATKLWTMPQVIIGALLIAGMGAAFTSVGVFASTAMAGIPVVAGMGAALMSFGLGLVVFAVALKILQFMFDDLAEAGMIAAGIVLSMGLMFMIVGAGFPSIMLGVTAVGAMGAALMSFSFGIIIFAVAIKILESMFDDLAEAGKIAAGIVLSMGLVFMLVGAASPAILLGTIAVSLMGVSLILFSLAIMSMAAALKISDTLGVNIDQLGSTVSGILKDVGLTFVLLGAMSPLIMLGSASVALMGSTMLVFSIGLAAFSGALLLTTKALDKNVEEVGAAMGSVLSGIGMAVSGLGAQIITITLGAASLILIGAALAIAGVGILSFGSSLIILNNKGLLEKDEDGNDTIKGIGILSGLANQMADIGWTFMTNPWTVLGITSSIGMGIALTSIGIGLSIAADALGKVPDMSSFIDKLFAEDTGLIPVMAKAFGDIGEKYSPGVLGFISGLVGADPVSKGMRTVKGMGSALQDIAGGIVAFSNFAEFPVKVPDPADPSKLIYTTVNIFDEVMPKLKENLPSLLTVLADVFAEIGNNYGGGFLSDGPVKKGVDAVKGIGSVLSELAGGIVAFANFQEFPVQIAGEDGKLTYKNIVLWDEIPKIKTNLIGDGKIGKDLKSNGLLFSLASIFASIGEKYGDGFFSDGPVKKGVDAVKGIGKVVSELAGGIIAFANMQRGLPNYDKDGNITSYTPFNISDVKTNIIKVLTQLPDAFANIDIKKFEEAKEKAKAAQPLAEIVSKIAKSLEKLQSKGKEPLDASILSSMGAALKSFSIAISGMELDKDKVKSIDKLADAIKKMSSSGDKLKVFAEALSATASSLKSFSSAFIPFSNNLEKLDKFEKSFSNLSKNAHTYKFDKFSESMGTLKTNINAFNVENLKLTDSLMKSLAILSKSPDALGATIDKSIKEAFAQMIEALKELGEKMKPESSVSPPPVNEPTPKVKEQIQTKQPIAPQLTKSDIESAFKNALKMYSSGDSLKVTNTI